MSYDQRAGAWDAYFGSVTCMAFHPGTSRENAVKRSVAECAAIADEMLKERDKRFPREYPALKAAV